VCAADRDELLHRVEREHRRPGGELIGHVGVDHLLHLRGDVRPAGGVPWGTVKRLRVTRDEVGGSAVDP
jgi:hypothetical protein